MREKISIFFSNLFFIIVGLVFIISAPLCVYDTIINDRFKYGLLGDLAAIILGLVLLIVGLNAIDCGTGCSLRNFIGKFTKKKK